MLNQPYHDISLMLLHIRNNLLLVKASAYPSCYLEVYTLNRGVAKILRLVVEPARFVNFWRDLGKLN